MESIIRKRRITINIFAITSCVFMIISNIFWTICSEDSFYYFIKLFFLILFLFYTLFFYHKNKFKILGIISIFVNMFFYIFIQGFANSFNEHVFETILIIIFSISLFKKLNMSIDIITTIILFASIGFYLLDELYSIFEYLPVGIFTLFPVGIFTLFNLLYVIGFVLFLTTIYLMAFFQAPVEKNDLGESFMIGLGSFLTLVGFVLVVIGNSMNNDVSSQIDSFFESGKTGTGDNFVTFGILIAIIGIILLATGIALKIRKSSPKTIQKQKIYICRNCGEELEQNTKFCGNCGKSVMQIKTCPNCNNEIKTNYKFCQNCGFDLSAPQKNNNKI